MPDLLHPLALDGVRLPNNLVLSPMAGYSDLPFRVLCHRHGAGLVSSEMVAAANLERGGDSARRRMRTTIEERPTSIQIFGTDPDHVAAAAREAERDCDVLGFNMGCPAPQIRRQGCGAALLDRPDLAVRLVESIHGASKKPLLVKIRAGNHAPMDLVAFTRRLEAAGAGGLILHGRTAAQGYSGRADWSVIRKVKAGVGIPVIGNGDVVDGPSAAVGLRESGADGVALGRAALGDPRIFHRIAHYLGSGRVVAPPTAGERARDFLEYLRMAQDIGLGTSQILHQAQRFTKGLIGGAELRQRFQGGAMRLETIRASFEVLAAVA